MMNKQQGMMDSDMDMDSSPMGEQDMLMDGEKKTYFVDRIEGGKAYIQIDDGSTVDVDASLLDPTVTAGTYIYDDGTPAPEATGDATTGIDEAYKRMQSQDPGGNIKL